MTACGSLSGRSGFFTPQDSAPRHNVDIAAIPNAVPRVEAKSKYGNPVSYVVFKKRYYVMSDSKDYKARGIASWYGTKFHGRKTSSGEAYDMFAMTAAHRTLPLPTYIQVTNLSNQRQVIVKVNDRGPFRQDRILDLSYAAASKLGILATGTALIDIKSIDPKQKNTPSTRPSPAVPIPAPAQAVVTTLSQTASRPAAQPTGQAEQIFLQVAAFKDRKNAERLRKKLATLSDTGIHIKQSQQKQNTIYRVSIGPFTSSNEAGQLAETITLLGFGNPQLIAD